MKRKFLLALFCLGVLGAMGHSTAAEKETPAAGQALTTVASLDVPRYMGTWFEIAKYPNWFQKKCSSATQAAYSLMADGRVQVINRCRQSGGEWTEAVGLARQLGPSNSPRLEVRFAPSWMSWLPFVWGNYWVIDLDEDYQLVAVSEPRREYLWVLSRTPKADPVRYQQLMNRLRQKGFDPDKLQVTLQD